MNIDVNSENWIREIFIDRRQDTNHLWVYNILTPSQKDTRKKKLRNSALELELAQ